MPPLEQYTEELFHCIRCGFCQIHCPVFKVVGNEPAVARGKLEMSKAVLTGRMGLTPRYGEYIYRCLLCGLCAQNCPAGVKVHDVIKAARETYCDGERPPAAMAELRERVRSVHNISGDANENRLLWLDDLAEPIPTVARRARAEVAYFVGCVSSLYPAVYRIPQSFVQVMAKADVDFTVLGGEEWCCGYPLIIGGMRKDAAALMEHNIERIRSTGARTLVTSCPSCYHTLKHDYVEAFGDLGFDVLHSTEFLGSLMCDGRMKFTTSVDEVVTYHDPCDLGRRNGIYDAPRRIIAGIPGTSLIEMKTIRENARCCGGGGNLEMNDAAVSGAVARDRIADALETGSSMVITACQQCKRTLQGAARAQRAKIKVVDLTEMLLRAMGV